MKKRGRMRQAALAFLMGSVFLTLAGCGERDEVPGMGVLGKAEETDGGVQYAVTDLNYAVVTRVPDGMEVLDLTGLEEEYQGIYLRTEALEGVSGLKCVTLGPSAAFDAELLDRLLGLPEFTYPEECLTSDWIITVEQAREVNRLRAENESSTVITPDLELTMAARTRGSELSELWSDTERPNGKMVQTILDEAGIPYTFWNSAQGHTADREKMEEEYIPALAEVWADADIPYDRIGCSVGVDTYEDGSPKYLLASLGTASNTVGTTDNGYTYELKGTGEDRYVCITDYAAPEEENNLRVPGIIGTYPVREIADEAFQDNGFWGIHLPDTVARIPQGLFDGCEELRAIQVGAEAEIARSIEEDYLVFVSGQDTGDGALKNTWVYEDLIFGQTDRDTFVLLDISPGISDVTIPAQYGDYPVTHIQDKAASRSEDITMIHVPEECGFSREFLEETTERDITLMVTNYENSVAKGLVCTYEAADAINEMRENAGLEEIRVSEELVRVARVRAQELEEHFGGTRPDGTNGNTAIDEAGYPYEISYQKLGQGRTLEALQEEFYDEWYKDFAYMRDYKGEEYLIDEFGVGVYLGEQDGEQKTYLAWVGIKSEDVE